MNTLSGSLSKARSRRSTTSPTLRIGLFGLGVVGSGLTRILASKHDELRRRFGVNVEVGRICVRDNVKERDGDLPTHLITTDLNDILSDDSIDVVVELIGGRYEALHVIERALESRKHVITANKLILSHELPRLKERAERQGVNLFYSASVCGSVPVLRAIDELRVGDEITSVRGIVNGSTNFILTSMTEQHVSYEGAICEARAKGFLEADPTLDVSGQDAAQKLAVIAYHAFGEHLVPSQIRTSGIESITLERIKAEEQSGRVLKLVAQASRDCSGRLSASVQPVALPRTHLFAHTRDEFNALEIETLHAGPQLLYGKGAGSLPTASAVLSDLIEVLRSVE